MAEQQPSDATTIEDLKKYVFTRYEREVEGSAGKMLAAQTYAQLLIAEKLTDISEGFIADQIRRIALGVEMLEGR